MRLCGESILRTTLLLGIGIGSILLPLNVVGAPATGSKPAAVPDLSRDVLSLDISISDVTVTEGDNGTTNAVLTIDLNEPKDRDITIDFETVDLTATAANGDYQAASGTVTVLAFELSTTLTVVVEGDRVREANQTFRVDISNPSDGNIVDDQGLVTILNDDGLPSLAIDDVTVTEGNAGTTSAVFTVSLSNPTDQAVTVDFATADSTATLANGDYQATSGTATIPAKALSTTVTVPVNGDLKRESSEVFKVALRDAGNATLADALGLGTILNDDGQPSLAIDDVTVTEGDAGTTSAVFTVSLSNPTDQAVTVDFATADSTATLVNGDYQAASGTVTIPVKASSGTITVLVNADLIRESKEIFKVALSNAGGATLADGLGLGTILNDDGLPTLTINDVTVTEGNGGTTGAVFTVSLSNPTDQAVTVDFATADSTATLGNGDYQTTSGTATIPAKTLSTTITVLANGDLTRESNEIFKVNLSNASNASIGDGLGLGTIQNDDGLPSVSINDVTVTEGNGGTTGAVFTLSLSHATDQVVTVSFAAADSTALLANGDYQAASGTATIPGKTLSTTVAVLVNGDLTRESGEVFKVTLSNPSNATLGDNHGLGTIQNDDGLPSVSINDVTVTEGNGGTTGAVFTVSLSNPTDQVVTVDFATADSTATLANGDYQSASGTLTIPAKAASGTITVLVNGDLTRESSEIFKVDLSNAGNATIADALGLGTILNDDGLPSVSINDVTVTEGNAGTTGAIFTVSLSNPTDQSVTVDFATTDSTATLGNGDYQSASGTLTIPAKAASGTITVLVNGDLTRESSEVFKVGLSNAGHATLADAQGVGTIQNNDGLPSLSINDVTVTEGDGGTTSAIFTVSLSNPTDQVVTMSFATADDSATLANGDYQATSGTLTIPAKTSSGTITVLVNGDLTRESNEVFRVNLSGPGNATIADAQGLGTIQNDDGKPTLTINDVTVTEANGGTTSAVFTVTLSHPTDQEVPVDFTTADSTARLTNSDYQASTGTLTIPPEALSGTITVPVNGDLIRESNEVFLVDLSLSNSGKATIADGQGLGTIQNDDGLPSLTINNVTVTEGNGGTTSAIFTVSLSNPTDQSVTVDFATADSTATLGNGDYQSASGTLTIPAKAASGTITVLVNGDLTRESSEVFKVGLSNAGNATIADALGLGTILNDDGLPTLTINDVTVTEGNAGTTSAVFTVSLSNPTDQVVTVDFATADSTATLANGDYQTASGTLTIPAKASSGTITVLVNGDLTRESSEVFKVGLSNAGNATIADALGLGTILNNDGLPTLNINDVTVTEGNAGTTSAIFTVSLSNPTDQAVTVDFATADSTATLANIDYQAASGTLTIPAKAPSGTITVLVNGDLTRESSEVFKVSLSNAGNATLADALGLGTILNNDVVPTLMINDVAVTEGNSSTTSAILTVSLSNASDQAVTANFATADFTARTSNGDYQSTSGTLTIPAKTLSTTVTVLVNGDLTRESNEVFRVNLSSATNAIIADGQGLGTILNDDGLPSLAINDVTVTEGNGGTTSAVFTVSLSNPTDQVVTVDFAAADSTATLANGDYQATSGTATIPAKTLSMTVTVLVNGDLTRESGEIFKVTLSNPSNATLGDNQGIGTILNDDGLPSVSINDVAVTEGNGGTTSALFIVSLSNPTDQVVTVDFTTGDSTATLANGDYQTASGTATIPAKALSTTVTVLVNGDLTRESSEVFKVNLSNAGNATLTDVLGLGTIQNDDGVPSLAIDDVTVTEGNGGTTSALFTVSLSHPTDQVVTVSFASADSTARLANGDYQATSGILAIPAKTLSTTVTVLVNGDVVRESNEIFKVILSAPTSAVLLDGLGLGTILNDDGQPSIAITDVSIAEGNVGTRNANFNVSLSHAADQPVTVDFATTDSTATAANGDYQATSGTLTIPAKTLSGTITVLVNGDLTLESNEVFKLNLGNAGNAVLGDAQALAAIQNDDVLPSLVINDATVIEGNGGTTSALFVVSMTNPTDRAVTVHYATADGTARLANNDYQAASGVLTIPPKASSGTITVSVNGDAIRESNEVFLVNLDTPVNATITDAIGVGRIQNDDGVPSLAVDDVAVTEGSSGTIGATFTVTLSHPTDQTVTVNFATADSTATVANGDYQSTSGILSIPPKAASGAFTVSVRGDMVRESNEIFRVQLSGPGNATLADAQGLGTILDDDGPPSLAIDDVTVTEGNNGTTSAVFTVSLSHATDQMVTVDYLTTDGAARQANGDYETAAGILAIPAKSTSGNITVLVNGDLTQESNEAFLVELTDASNAVLLDAQGIGVIQNDDGLPSVTIDDVTIAEGNAGTTAAIFTLTLSHATDQTVTVEFLTANATATLSNGDYQAGGGVLAIPAKTLAAQFAVLVNGDVLREEEEFFLVNLGNPSNATVADPVAIGTIQNDDELHATFVQSTSGFAAYSLGTLVPSWGDYDNDGDVDLPLYSNDGQGTFTEIPGFRNFLVGNYHGSSWGDYDKDGHLDLVILSYTNVPTRTLLLHNLGNGQFVDAAPSMGLDVQGFGETALWADFDLDGWPDLFAPYYSHVAPFQSYMYCNNGSGTLVDVSDSAGVALRNVPVSLKVEGTDVADWDDDGDLDFYAASHLFLNDGTGQFTDVRAQVGLPERFDEGAAFVDYDNDGDLDLCVRNVDTARLYRNDLGMFTDVTVAAGIQPAAFLWGDSWADVDNDGDVDFLTFVQGQPARLMLNQGNGTFAFDPAFLALGNQGGLSAWADANGDGDLDVVTGAFPTPRLYNNQLNNQPGFAFSYIRVRVLDAAGRETEQGATVRLRRLNGPPSHIQTRVVGGGSSYLNRSEYTVHFGAVDDGPYTMEVRYPSPPGERVIIDGEESTILSSLRPTKLAGKTLLVYRDGRVLLDDGPSVLPVPEPIPTVTELGLPSPNPIQSTGSVVFRLGSSAAVSLLVYDISGRRVKQIMSGDLPGGVHRGHWDRTDDRGERVRAGVYFYDLVVDRKSIGQRRVVVLP